MINRYFNSRYQLNWHNLQRFKLPRNCLSIINTFVSILLLFIKPQPVSAVEINASNCADGTEPQQALTTEYRSQTIDGIRIFYREAGDPRCPTILLLHGFSSSSQMFRELIPRLSHRFHLIAADYPGFGHSDAPEERLFKSDFESLTTVMEKFVQSLSLPPFILYMQDFGGPVGFRLAERHPDWIRGLIIQNANAYMEGLIRPKPSAKKNDQTPASKTSELVVNASFIRQLYHYGARNAAGLNPDAWTLDIAVLQNPDAKRIQSALIDDYVNNIARYPQWQQFLRDKQPQTLIVWGRHDQAFSVAGAEAYLKDVPKAKLQLFDTGHFALEEDVVEIARAIVAFFH